MSINFKEIPMANVAGGEQDTFELFARDFCEEALRFKIIAQPNRGADGGVDFLAEETLTGAFTSSKRKWLVSCKHNIHSGRAVNESDEPNIIDRLSQHKADGFLGIYSTIASSGLSNRLVALTESEQKPFECFDWKRIEARLLRGEHDNLFKRYFPESYAAWNSSVAAEAHIPSLIATVKHPLLCHACGRDLLDESKRDYKGNILYEYYYSGDERVYSHVYAACKQPCTGALDDRFRGTNHYTNWNDISDLLIPSEYLRNIIAMLNSLYDPEKWSRTFTKTAFDDYKDIMVRLGQYVFRLPSEEQTERKNRLDELPPL